ncbi:hypothetical protein CCPUN_09120 [Cardinium endosymbiont of Culicoides punctatus]|nr:hypothetical protein CCPUN_09120 [Cardinium endosymbiont of Culicoides punctatus]
MQVGSIAFVYVRSWICTVVLGWVNFAIFFSQNVSSGFKKIFGCIIIHILTVAQTQDLHVYRHAIPYRG